MKIFLVVSLMLTPGVWTPGSNLDGWSPREQPDIKTCIQRMFKAQASRPPENIIEWKWECRNF